MFLTDKYFQGELSLPGFKYMGETVGLGVVTQVISQNNLDWFIQKYERLFLIDLLGYDLYKNMVNGLSEPDNEKWTALRDVIFRSEGEYMFSPAANYVYFFTMRDGRTTTTTKGEVKDTQDHAMSTTEANKLIKAWNDIYPQVCIIYRFLNDNWGTYKNYGDKRCLCYKRFEPVNVFGI